MCIYIHEGSVNLLHIDARTMFSCALGNIKLYHDCYFFYSPQSLKHCKMLAKIFFPLPNVIPIPFLMS